MAEREVERYNRTLATEWAYARPFTSNTEPANTLTDTGGNPLSALAGGVGTAFSVGAAISATSIVLAAFLRKPSTAQSDLADPGKTVSA